MPNKRFVPPANLTHAIDIHVDNTWCYVTVVRSDAISYACLKRNRWQGVASVVAERGDLVAHLGKVVPLGHRVKQVPLADLHSIEWHDDDEQLILHHWNEDKKKLKRTTAWLEDQESRHAIVEAIQEGVIQAGIGQSFEESSAKPSIWHTAITPLILSAVATLLFVLPGFARLGSTKQLSTESSGRNAELKEAIAALHNALGPWGTLLVGLGIVAAMLLWWFLSHQWSPDKTIAKISEPIVSLGKQRRSS